ncbi:oligosaccharide flippase family protein [Reichenbachiella agarivorans]|uniref:Oligosaccharide flippase family protein n=1 Tax=Reichenbachiella agarivorans TaxID=2979464 RepID=A0ABY6CNL5_9BACT|nr:oligosaccharide flippase family protein [Reichenbachiella agarivorans]UXP32101.1 oligosaccharide flippase family protein [Reichenbachiella agarivorans]
MYSVTNELAKPVQLRAYFTPVRIFLISTMLVNGGNYAYNLVLGRVLTPSQFAEAGILVTLLLAFSFLAMTFQIVSAKYSIELEGIDKVAFRQWITKISLWAGGILSLLVMLASGSISEFFHIDNTWALPTFSLALPLYFLMSVKRGFLQGTEKFVELSTSYQTEMWVRLLMTFALIFLLDGEATTWVSLAIVASVLVGYQMTGKTSKVSMSSARFEQSQLVWRFFLLTAAYECAQIIINYSDIIMVKHYFDSHQAGLYTSMALIGRMIYFVTWMVVMILIPRIVKLRKEGKAFKTQLLQYILVISVFSIGIASFAFFFPNLIVLTLFGEAYMAIAPYLWLYAFATMLFALSNVFVYYFLSIDQYLPVYIAIFMGLMQVVLIYFFHESLVQVIYVQIFNLNILLVVQVLFFVRKA